VVLALSDTAAARLAKEAAAVAFAHDAFAHLKVIGHTQGAAALLKAAGIEPDEGIVALDGGGAAERFVEAAAGGRIWAREPKVRTVF
jgi:catalase